MEKLRLNIQLFGGSLSISASETDVNINNNTSYINVSITATTTSGTYNETGSAYVQGTITGQNNTFTIPKTYFKISKGSSKVVYTGKIGPFNHNADGSLNNVSISARAYIVENTQPTASASVPMSTIPRASTFTITGGTIGQTITINITRASSSFTHDVRITYGSKTQILSTNAGTSVSATLDMDFCNQIPNNTTAQGIVSVATKNGNTYIGETQNKLFTMTVPSSVVPTISSVAKSDTAGYLSTHGAYVQGKSNLRVVTTRSGAYSSTISSTTVNIKNSGGTILRTLSGTDVTLSNINYVGTLTIQVIVKDSRNREATNTSTITVASYSNPVISTFTAERLNNNSTVTLKWNASITNINNHNSNAKTFRIYVREKGTSSWGSAIVTYNSDYSYSNNNYTITKDENKSWEFLFQAQDSFTTTTKTDEVGTAFELINWGSDGNSMAIGKVAERPNSLEVALEIYNRAIDTFDDTMGTDWKTMIKNKLDYCISNAITAKDYSQIFINGGWRGTRYGFGIYSKINDAYQIVWYSANDIIYCLKYNGTYRYRRQEIYENGFFEKIPNNSITIHKGSLSTNSSYKSDKSLNINMKIVGVTQNAGTTLTIATIPYYASTEASLMAVSSNYQPIVCWLRNNGTIAIVSGTALNNTEIRIVGSVYLD